MLLCSNYVTIFKLCYNVQTMLHCSNYVTMFKLCYNFQTMLHYSNYITMLNLYAVHYVLEYLYAGEALENS